jgi:hypothetical protein
VLVIPRGRHAWQLTVLVPFRAAQIGSFPLRPRRCRELSRAVVVSCMIVFQIIAVGGAADLGDAPVSAGQDNVALVVVVLLNGCGVLVRYRTPYSACVAAVTLTSYIITNILVSSTSALVLRVYLLACGALASVAAVKLVRAVRLGCGMRAALPARSPCSLTAEDALCIRTLPVCTTRRMLIAVLLSPSGIWLCRTISVPCDGGGGGACGGTATAVGFPSLKRLRTGTAP